MKKRFIALVLVGAMAATTLLIGCNNTNKTDDTKSSSISSSQSQKETSKAEDVVGGGWTVNQKLNIDAGDDKAFDVFKKAVEEKEKAEKKGFSPIALLGTQVVNGTNYMFLAMSRDEVENPEDTTKYEIVVVGEDTDGKTSFISENAIDLSDVKTIEKSLENATGSSPMNEDIMKILEKAQNTYIDITWTLNENVATGLMDEEDKKVFDKAVESYTGVGLEPIYMLGTQVVNGLNRMYLCKGSTVTAEPETHYYIAVVTEGTDGTTEVTSCETLDLSLYTA